MYLTKEEEKALDGEFGNGISMAYKILLAIGNANEASKLIPVQWAHISGVNYNTIGNSGVQFLKKLDSNTRVTIPTTLNPMGFDSKKRNMISEEFKENQFAIVNSYANIGVTQSFTCIPYEIFDLPKKNSVVSFAESNAAVYANSILGLKTNKESALSALASAITGKTPYAELLLDKVRDPKTVIVSKMKLETELDYGLLGYFAGKVGKESCMGLNLQQSELDIAKSKSISSGIGTSGTCGMFKEAKEGQELIEFDDEEYQNMKDELGTSESGDLIVLGSPQLGKFELHKMLDLMKGRKFTKKCMIFCPRIVKQNNEQLVEKLENSGCEIICDACTCLTPLITRENYDSIITNSIKCAYYMKHSNKIDVALKDIKSITEEHTK
ncbi:MAG: aconitase X [Nitrososphaeraceae archaeon]